MPSPLVLPECLLLVVCSLYIYISSASGTLHFNLTSVIFTINLQSLFSKVRVPPETLFHFSHPSVSVRGSFSTLSWSPPPQTLPLLGVWQGNKCPINHLWTLIPNLQAGGKSADVLRALMLLPWGVTRVTLGCPKGLQTSTQGQNTDPPKHCPEKCRSELLPDLLRRVNYLSGPKRVIKIHIRVSLGQWVLIRSPILC